MTTPSNRKRRDEVERATAEWVSWYNTERPHRSNANDMPPATAEALYYDNHRADQPAAA
ncbi:integrase core domain-containing protein [Actinomyces oris]|uniref:Integrase core domain-containing protein n=1 Tax=Actinomyces oris TaxID=544580 RepID=A0AAW9KJH8_9ACTO|nr:integrase core domain-containing protein [Actinomyces oris]MEA1304496.1 integrase core domain-containing protein [Actinomyces oris]